MSLLDNVPVVMFNDAAVRESIREAMREERLKAEGTPSISGGLSTSGDVLLPPDNPDALMRQYKRWVYSAVQVNALGVSDTPLRLYVTTTKRTRALGRPCRPVSKAKREQLERRPGLQPYLRKAVDVLEVEDHPFLELWRHPNDHQTGSQFQRLIVTHLDLVGDFWTWILLDSLGRPNYLVVLPPGSMQVLIGSGARNFIAGYEQKVGTEVVKFKPQEIMHCAHVDPANPVYGYSPLEAVHLEAKLYGDANIFEYSLLHRGAVPGVVISLPDGVSPEDAKRMERTVNMRSAGPMNAGRTVVANQSEVKVEHLSLSPREMQMREGRRLLRSEICAAFNVPLSLLTTDGVPRANAVEAERSHAKLGISPRCTLIEDQLNVDIIPLYGDPNLFAAYDDPTVVDPVLELEREKAELASGTITINEYRTDHGRGPVPGGDTPLVPGAQRPLGDAPPLAGPPAPTPPPPGDEEAETEERHAGKQQNAVSGLSGTKAGEEINAAGHTEALALQAAIEKALVEQREEVLAAMAASGEAPPAGVDVWLWRADDWAEMYAEGSQGYVWDMTIAGMDIGANQIGMAGAFTVGNPHVAEAVRETVIRLSERLWGEVSDTTAEKLKQTLVTGLDAGEGMPKLTARVMATMGPEANRARAFRIAQTERKRFTHAGQQIAWQQSGVVSAKVWRTSGSDVCAWCVPMEGKVVELEQTFFAKGDDYVVTGADGTDAHMRLDYSDTPSPPLHPHCRCFLQPMLIGESGT